MCPLREHIQRLGWALNELPTNCYASRRYAQQLAGDPYQGVPQRSLK